MVENTPAHMDIVRSEFAQRVSYWEDVYLSKRNWDADARMRLEITRGFAQKYVPSEDASVLDVGCGAGIYMAEFSKMGYGPLTGVDITPEMIERAQALWPKLRPDSEPPTWVVSELENLPSKLSGEEYTLAVCAGLFEYLHDDDLALTALKKVIKPGGYLILTIPNSRALTPVQVMSNIKAGWNRLAPEKLRIPSAAAYYRKRYRLGKFLQQAENNGYESVEWRGHGHSMFPFLTSVSVIKFLNDQLGNMLDRTGTLPGFKWLQHAGTNYVVVLRAR
jgi:ubiquinone/menaquinone biosynthesis C-methylase UbiE